MGSNADWQEWREKVASHCYGRWESISSAVCNNAGIHTLLKGTNITCPKCGGKEKLYIGCKNTLRAHCCAATCKQTFFDGIHLLAELDGVRQKDMVKKIAQHENIDDVKTSTPKTHHSFKRKLVQQPTLAVETEQKPVINERVSSKRNKLLSELAPISEDTGNALKYYENRGIDLSVVKDAICNNLHFHKSLHYYKKILDDNDVVIDEEKGNFFAIVAKVLDCNYELVGFHKTYLSENGTKADVSDPKQMEQSLFKGQYAKNGSIVKLCEPKDGRYGICEGIETGLAVLSMNRPCWPVLNANGFKSFKPPKDCKVLDLYGDLDKSGTGQLVMIEKYIELRETRPEIQVNLYLPPESMWCMSQNPKGIDFLDAFIADKRILPAVGNYTC